MPESAHGLFNLAEGTLGILVALVTLRMPLERRWVVFGGFIAFGISDFVEIHTGAWWRPWWLLGWKAACLLAFVPPLFQHLRSRDRGGDPDE